MSCHLCSSEKVRWLGVVGLKPGSVTSDSRLHSTAASIWYCPECGHLQKLPTRRETDEIHAIYRDYMAHYLSNGVEQLTFPEGLPPRPRSYHVMEKIRSLLPKKGSLLDIGAGNGAVLNSAKQLLPEWNLFAYDVSDHCRTIIEAMPGVRQFTTDLENLTVKQFDLVVLWHALEHIPRPMDLMKRIRRLLKSDGLLLIQIPDIERNLFDLGVFDHISHFSHPTLEAYMRGCGYRIQRTGNDWVSNCLTSCFKIEDPLESASAPPRVDARLEDFLVRLNALLDRFRKAVGDSSSAYAIFGTSQAALLTYQQMDHPPLSFVDEDPHRQGASLLGIKVVHPNSLDQKIRILMPFSKQRGHEIACRLMNQHQQLRIDQFVWGAL